jgi:hypothetical protein
MVQTSDAGKLTEEFKHLVDKAVQGNMSLSKRVSTMLTELTTEFYSGRALKTLPSAGESVNRLAELSLSYWAAAVDHSLAFANSVAGAYEKTFELKTARSVTPAASQPIRKTRAHKTPKKRGKTRT